MQEAAHETRYQVAWRIAAVAGGFCVVVAALLAYDYSLRGAKNPTEELSYKALGAALASHPTDESLKDSLRTLNYEYARQYFRHKAFRQAGAGLLVGGLIVFVIAARAAVGLRRRLPDPLTLPSKRDFDAETALAARWGLVGVALVLACGAIGLAAAVRLPWSAPGASLASSAASSGGGAASGSAPAPSATSAVAAPAAAGSASAVASVPAAGAAPGAASIDAATWAKAWPRFRGPEGNGVSAFDNLPEKWDAASGENIRWQSAVPLPGNNSPIVIAGRVFLSGATETERKVFCFDAESGALVWAKDVPSALPATAEPPKVMEATGFAAPTMTTDGTRVFAIFANGDIAAFTLKGDVAWSKNLGVPTSSYGYASSLAYCTGLVIVQFDQGSADDKASKLFGLNAATGEAVWVTPRDVGNSWPSPIVAHLGGGEQIVTSATPWVIAYDPATGREIWRAKCIEADAGPSPVARDGVVYAANQFPAISAIQADGQGDVSESKILWKTDAGSLPDTSSPLATPAYLITAAAGTLTCYDRAKGGKPLWELEVEGDIVSSPSLVGQRLYVFDKLEGKAWVIEPTPSEGKIVAESNLGEPCVTSPAFQDGCFYVRGHEHLFCVGKK